MPLGVFRYPRSVPPESHWEALYQANRQLTDLVLDDLAELARGAGFADLSLAEYLPPAYLHRYDIDFLRRFLACVSSVGLKMALPGYHPAGCTGEEIAVYVMKELAAELLEDNHEEAEFGEWDELALEDVDCEFLFDPRFDGIEDSPIAEEMRFANLRFEDWFKPFNRPRYMHPYANMAEAPPWEQDKELYAEGEAEEEEEEEPPC